MTEEGCKLMATLGVVVNSLGNLEAVLPAASALAKRHVDYGVKAADYTPVGAAPLRTLEQGLDSSPENRRQKGSKNRYGEGQAASRSTIC